METIKFRTDIECTGCLSKVTPALNDRLGAGNWSIDLLSRDKTLTVPADVDEQMVIDILRKKGYNAIRLIPGGKIAMMDQF